MSGIFFGLDVKEIEFMNEATVETMYLEMRRMDFLEPNCREFFLDVKEIEFVNEVKVAETVYLKMSKNGIL